MSIYTYSQTDFKRHKTLTQRFIIRTNTSFHQIDNQINGSKRLTCIGKRRGSRTLCSKAQMLLGMWSERGDWLAKVPLLLEASDTSILSSLAGSPVPSPTELRRKLYCNGCSHVVKAFIFRITLLINYYILNNDDSYCSGLKKKIRLNHM